MKTSRIKSKKFYQEAEDMQDGWGKYLQSIDVLKDKFDNNEKLRIKEASWIMWAEKHIQSNDYLAFQKWCKQNKLYNKFFQFNIWWELFNGFMQTRNLPSM